jgi:hypothetical protein
MAFGKLENGNFSKIVKFFRRIPKTSPWPAKFRKANYGSDFAKVLDDSTDKV